MLLLLITIGNGFVPDILLWPLGSSPNALLWSEDAAGSAQMARFVLYSCESLGLLRIGGAGVQSGPCPTRASPSPPRS
jgi:hypothetical protein